MMENQKNIDKTFLIFDTNYVFDNINKVSDDLKSFRFVLEGEIFGLPIEDSRIINNIEIILEHFLKQKTNALFVVKYDYETNLINIVKRGQKVKKKITFSIPYGRREDYYKFVYEVNKLVDREGLVDLYVNNVPYNLSSYLVIETDKNYDEIDALGKKYKLSLNREQGFDELFQSLGLRQYNVFGFIKDMSFEQVYNRMKYAYQLPSKYHYESQGYSFKKIKKPRLFISYSHKDSQKVNDVVSEFEKYGLHFWQDRYEIMPGELMMQRIHEGIEECDLPIVFISENTNISAFAKHELTTFFNGVIYQEDSAKKWFIVKLDDVNPNDIYKGLANYLYFDLTTLSVEELVEMIQKKLGKKEIN